MANINGGTIKYDIDFEANTSKLKDLQAQLLSLKTMTQSKFMKLNPTMDTSQVKSEMKSVQADLAKVSTALNKSFNMASGTIDISKFNQSLAKSGTTITSVQNSMSKLGAEGKQSFMNLGSAISQSNRELYQSITWMDKLKTSFLNTVKWTVMSSIVNGFSRSVYGAYSYVKQLDSSLNDIRIVTEKSSDEMAAFAKQANNAAKALSTTTTTQTNAALIQYQQGLGDAEVNARTETTIKAANVTGQTGEEVSDQLTAVWNGYKVTAEETELYVDKLAAVAATTSSDLEELSTGMSKVASAANSMGVGMDSLNAQLATVISVTREAPESVGNALKTIQTRMADLELGDSDEDGAVLGDVSSSLAKMGVNILTTEGELRDLEDVIEEVGEKWNSGAWSNTEKQALAIDLAGKRQYNNLIALFDNWDMYKSSLETSAESAGTLEKQQEIYTESISAHLKTLQASIEDFQDSLLNDSSSLNGIIDFLSSLVDGVTGLVDAMGGLGGVLNIVAPLLLSIFNSTISKTAGTIYSNMKATSILVKNRNASLEQEKQLRDSGKSEAEVALNRDRLRLDRMGSRVNPQVAKNLAAGLDQRELAINTKNQINEKYGEKNITDAVTREALKKEYQKNASDLRGLKKNVEFTNKDEEERASKIHEQKRTAKNQTDFMDKNSKISDTITKIAPKIDSDKAARLGISSGDFLAFNNLVFKNNGSTDNSLGALSSTANQSAAQEQINNFLTKLSGNNLGLETEDANALRKALQDLNVSIQNRNTVINEAAEAKINLGTSTQAADSDFNGKSVEQKDNPLNYENKLTDFVNAAYNEDGTVKSGTEKSLNQISTTLKNDGTATRDAKILTKDQLLELIKTTTLKTESSKLEDLLKSIETNTEDAAKEQEGQQEDIDEDAKKVEQADNQMEQGEENFDLLEKQENIELITSGFMQLGTAISTVTSLFNTLNSITEIWSDVSTSGEEKMLKTFTIVGGMIPAIIISMKSLSSITDIFTGVSGSLKLLTKSKQQDTAATNENTNSQAINNATQGQSSAQNVAEAATEGASSGATEGNTIKTNLNTKAKLKNIAATMASNLAIAAVIAVLVLAAIIISQCTDAWNADAKAAAEAAEAAENAAAAAKKTEETYNSLKESIEDYDTAVDSIDKLTMSTKEFEDAVESANERAQSLIDTYSELKDQYYVNSEGIITFYEGDLEEIEAKQEKMVDDSEILTSGSTMNAKNKQLTSDLTDASREAIWIIGGSDEEEHKALQEYTEKLLALGKDVDDLTTKDLIKAAEGTEFNTSAIIENSQTIKNLVSSQQELKDAVEESTKIAVENAATKNEAYNGLTTSQQQAYLDLAFKNVDEKYTSSGQKEKDTEFISKMSDTEIAAYQESAYNIDFTDISGGVFGQKDENDQDITQTREQLEMGVQELFKQEYASTDEFINENIESVKGFTSAVDGIIDGIGDSLITFARTGGELDTSLVTDLATYTSYKDVDADKLATALGESGIDESLIDDSYKNDNGEVDWERLAKDYIDAINNGSDEILEGLSSAAKTLGKNASEVVDTLESGTLYEDLSAEQQKYLTDLEEKFTWLGDIYDKDSELQRDSVKEAVALLAQERVQEKSGVLSNAVGKITDYNTYLEVKQNEKQEDADKKIQQIDEASDVLNLDENGEAVYVDSKFGSTDKDTDKKVSTVLKMLLQSDVYDQGLGVYKATDEKGDMYATGDNNKTVSLGQAQDKEDIEKYLSEELGWTKGSAGAPGAEYTTWTKGDKTIEGMIGYGDPTGDDDALNKVLLETANEMLGRTEDTSLSIDDAVSTLETITERQEAFNEAKGQIEEVQSEADLTDNLETQIEYYDNLTAATKEAYEAAVQLNNLKLQGLETETDNLLDNMTDLQSAITALGDNFIASSEDAQTLAKTFPELLEGATTLADGRVQLNEEVAQSVLGLEATEIDSAKDTLLAKYQQTYDEAALEKAKWEARLEQVENGTATEEDMEEWANELQKTGEAETTETTISENAESVADTVAAWAQKCAAASDYQILTNDLEGADAIAAKYGGKTGSELEAVVKEQVDNYDATSETIQEEAASKAESDEGPTYEDLKTKEAEQRDQVATGIKNTISSYEKVMGESIAGQSRILNGVNEIADAADEASEKWYETSKKEIDLYYDINKEIDKADKKIKKLTDNLDKASGANYKDTVTELATTYQSENLSYQEYNNELSAENARTAEDLKKRGIEFNEDGSISNYGAFSAKWDSWMNDSTLTDEQRSELQKEYDAILDEIQSYDDNLDQIEDNVDKIEENDEAMQELYQDMSDKYLNALTGIQTAAHNIYSYVIQTEERVSSLAPSKKIWENLSDNLTAFTEKTGESYTSQEKLADVLNDAGYSVNSKGNIVQGEGSRVTDKDVYLAGFGLTTTTTGFTKAVNAQNDFNEAQKALYGTKDHEGLLDTYAYISNMSEEEQIKKYGSHTAWLEELSKYAEEIQNLEESSYQDIEDMAQGVKDMADSVNTSYAREQTLLTNAANIIDNTSSLLSKTNNILKTSSKQDKDASFNQTQTLLNQKIETEKESLSRYQSQIEYYENTYLNLIKEQYGESSEEYQQAYDDYVSLLNEAYSAAEQTLEDMATALKNEITKAFDDIEYEYTGALGWEQAGEEWELVKRNQEMYLDDANKTYKTQQLIKKYQSAIDNSSSVSAQKKLNSLMEEQLGQLKEKQKLTEYDLEAAEKRYEIALAEIALEEAQQNKSKLRLRRDSQGNQTYQYVADEDEVSNLEDDLAEKWNSYYNSNVDELKSLYDSQFSLLKEYQQKMEEIMNIEDEGQREEALEKLREQYLSLFQSISEEIGAVRENTASSMVGTLQTSLEINKENFEDFSGYTQEKWESMFAEMNIDTNDFSLLTQSTAKEIYNGIQEGTLEPLKETWGETFSSMNTTAGQAMDALTTAILTDAETWRTNAESKIDAIAEKITAFTQQVEDLVGDSENGLIGKLTDLDEDGFSEVANSITDAQLKQVVYTTATEGFVESTAPKLLDALKKMQTRQSKIATNAEKANTNANTLTSLNYEELLNQLASLKQAFEDLEEAISKIERDVTINVHYEYDPESGDIGGDDTAVGGGNVNTANAVIAEKYSLEGLKQIVNSSGQTTVQGYKMIDKATGETVFSGGSADELDKYVESLGGTAEGANKLLALSKDNLKKLGTTDAISSQDIEAHTLFVTKHPSGKQKLQDGNKGVLINGGYLNPVADIREQVRKKIQQLPYANENVLDRLDELIEKASNKKGGASVTAWFDTGGYTGDWDSKEGKLAVLHEKELVLNKQDTSNVLAAVNLVRSMGDILSAVGGRLQDMNEFVASSSSISSLNNTESNVNQEVTIHAEFPNVTAKQEIEDAFQELSNILTQKAYSNRR